MQSYKAKMAKATAAKTPLKETALAMAPPVEETELLEDEADDPVDEAVLVDPAPAPLETLVALVPRTELLLPLPEPEVATENPEDTVEDPGPEPEEPEPEEPEPELEVPVAELEAAEELEETTVLETLAQLRS